MGTRPRTIHRIITRASVFLLLGAIVNVSTAWTLWVTMDPWYVPDTHGLWRGWSWSDQGTIMWASRVLRAGGGHTELWQCQAGVTGGFDEFKGIWMDKLESASWAEVPHWSAARASGAPKVESNGVEFFIVDEARGWPCMSMRDRLMFRYPLSQPAATSIEVEGGLELSLRGALPSGLPCVRVLPLTPIWPGFAINTLFYAAILWLSFAAPFALRRRRRIKRGLCPACAYPVGKSDVCTECGHSLSDSFCFTNTESRP
jgi:hypothetical protein